MDGIRGQSTVQTLSILFREFVYQPLVIYSPLKPVLLLGNTLMASCRGVCFVGTPSKSEYNFSYPYGHDPG
jgi:hypothetical protein